MDEAVYQSLSEAVRSLQRTGALTLPAPASGHTTTRLRALYELGRQDLSIARIAEAHTDALAILAEAGRSPSTDGLYGVWASDGPAGRLEVNFATEGTVRLRGSKQYCTGAPFLDHALITAHGEAGLWLIDLPLKAPQIRIEASGWATPAFSATGTATVHLNDTLVTRGQVIATPNWYLERIGFWQGALAPAACWAGGAAGLVDAARGLRRRDPHARAQLGALEADEWGLRAILDQAAAQIDADPKVPDRIVQRLALIVRHLVERTCTDILDRFGRATGPQLLAFDSKTAQRYSELTLYIRQCHAERDLEALASVSVNSQPANTGADRLSNVGGPKKYP